MLYALICLCLSLAGVAGLQMMYLFYVDRLDKERKKRVHELELHCKTLTARLHDAEDRIEEQNEMLAALGAGPLEEEAWADVLDDR
ncbi:MAG: hypothetical protein H7070_06765 [Saprospiraceae bacterium]|nr:hypothetical protein [Pyrinomonadaceae bacterium]